MYRKAILSDPMNSSALSNLADLLHFVKESHEEALVFYRRATEADSGNSEAFGQMAYLLHTVRKNYKEAEDCYLRSVFLISSVQLSQTRARFIGPRLHAEAHSEACARRLGDEARSL
jgi:tetratricopeptide (TPR) repeat protein